jgi:glucose-1-phosphate cytidylyltransferase
MKVVILAGGFGTRIRDVAEDVPKPMIKIGGYPIIWHIMKRYHKFGFKDFLICTGYKGEIIKDFFLNYRSYVEDIQVDNEKNTTIYLSSKHNEDWKVTLIDTGLNTMTGARISRVRRFLDSEPFCLTYGDGVSDICIKSLVEFHAKSEKVLTVTGVRPPGRFGEITLDDSGQVVAFNEKPQTTDGCISGGYFVANPDIFHYLDDDEALVFENDPIKLLTREKQLAVFKHNGFWHPMDTARDYQLLTQMYASNNAIWLD